MKRLVLTLAFGDQKELGNISIPLMEQYAKKTESDFYVITDCRNPSNPLYEKLRIREYLEKYDQVLCIDADCLVRPDTPNLFELVPSDSLAMYDEGSSIRISEIENRVASIYRIALAWGLVSPLPSAHLHYYNCGVILASKQHKLLFSPPIPEPYPDAKGPCGDQAFVNYMIQRNKPKMWHLPVCFNQMPFNMMRDYQDQSFIIHYANLGNTQSRYLHMQDDLAYWRQAGVL